MMPASIEIQDIGFKIGIPKLMSNCHKIIDDYFKSKGYKCTFEYQRGHYTRFSLEAPELGKWTYRSIFFYWTEDKLEIWNDTPQMIVDVVEVLRLCKAEYTPPPALAIETQIIKRINEGEAE